MNIKEIPSTKEFEDLVRRKLVEKLHKRLDGESEQIRYLTEKYQTFIDIMQEDILRQIKLGERSYQFHVASVSISNAELFDLLEYNNYIKLVEIVMEPFKKTGYNMQQTDDMLEAIENLDFNNCTWTVNIGW